MFIDPFRPLGLSVFAGLFNNILNFLQVKIYTAGGRLYTDNSQIVDSLKEQVEKGFNDYDSITNSAIKDILNRPGFVAGLPSQNKSVKKMLLKFMLRALWNFKIRFLFYPETIVEHANQETQRFKQQLLELLSRKVESSEERLNIIKNEASACFEKSIISLICSVFLCGMISGDLVKKIVKDKDMEVKLFVGLKGNITTNMSLEVGDLCDIARKCVSVEKKLHYIVSENNANPLKFATTQSIIESFNSEEQLEFKNALVKFLDKYGFRCPGEIDITNPRWKENCLFIIRTISGQLKNSKMGEHKKQQEKAEKAGMDYCNEVIQKVRNESRNSIWNWLTFGIYSPIKTWIVQKLMNISRASMATREHPKFLIASYLEMVRTHLHAVGEDLCSKGYFNDSKDVHYLTFDELTELVKSDNNIESSNVKKLINFRKQEYEKFKKLTPPPILTHDGEDVYQTYMLKQQSKYASENALIGTPVCAGIIEGIARVISDPTKATLQKGEILVCKNTDPGWTPLFISAAGLVTEIGGLLTHGSVIAREMGIPAVVGVRDCTKKIKDGQKIIVDARVGVVKLL